MWVLLLVPMVPLLWCEAWDGWGIAWCLWVGGGRGGGVLGGKEWEIYARPLVGMVDGSSPADECGLSNAFVLSLYFPYPFCPCMPIPIGPIVSLPYFLYPFVPFISHNNDTCAPTAWCWELLFYIAPNGWLLISPLKCFWPVCWAVSGQASGLLGAWPMWHSLGYGIWVGICHCRHSFPYNGSWWLRNTSVTRKLLGGRRDAIALKPQKADVPLVGNWRSYLKVAVTPFWNDGFCW